MVVKVLSPSLSFEKPNSSSSNNKVQEYAPEMTGCFAGIGDHVGDLWPGAIAVKPKQQQQKVDPPPPPKKVKKKKKAITPFSFFTCADESTSVEPESPTLLDWRLDPAASLADWTIVITTPLGTKEDAKTYHVHRNMMLTCQFFAQLFQEEEAGGKSEFELPEEAAEKFPHFLDYLYRLEMKIHRGNAIPFYYLSRLLGVQRLRWESKKFWSSDLSLQTTDFYYESAIIFQEEILMKELLQACLKDEVLRGIDKDSKVVTIPCPRLWVFLANSIQREQSDHLSKIIAAFCVLHKEHLDAEVFNDLTQKLPVVNVQAAVTLLQLESELAKPALMSNLQRAAIRAFSQNWEKLDVSSTDFLKMMASQSAPFLARVFCKTVLKAQASAAKNNNRYFPTRDELRDNNSLVDNKQKDEEEDVLDPIVTVMVSPEDTGTQPPVREIAAAPSWVSEKSREPPGFVVPRVTSPLTVDEAVAHHEDEQPAVIPLKKDEEEKKEDMGDSGEITSMLGLQVSVSVENASSAPDADSTITELEEDTVEV